MGLLPAVFSFPSKETSSCFMIEYEASRQFLHRSAHSHDASRGVELTPAAAQIFTSNDSFFVFGDSNLESIPLPDFSMPFNVIAISSSAMAFLFGSFLNLIFKVRFYPTTVPVG